MTLLMNDTDNESSLWQSYDSAEGTDSECSVDSGHYAGLTLTRTPNSKRDYRLHPLSISPDRQAVLPAEPQFNSAWPEPSSAQLLSASYSNRSIASTLCRSAPSILDHRFHCGDAPARNVYLFAPPTLTFILRDSSMDQISVTEICDRLGSDEDAIRKMAAFKLQSNVGDPSFVETFILQGGLAKLKYLIMRASGNTLAYSLASFSKLLEVDKGWECIEQDLIVRVVELVVTHPLVNILRGAMGILVSVVSRPYNPPSSTQSENFGFKALKPAISVYPQFLEMLVSRLSSADHALCANALQLINSLMRDAIMNDAENEWPKFIKRLQDLGVIKAVYVLMQSSAIQDLAHPLLEFQALTKVLLRRWKDVPVDLQKPEHRRALKGIHLASNPEKPPESTSAARGQTKPKHNPEKWRRLGFESESPAGEFQDMGFLGMMDLTDYVRKHQDEFQRLLLEQSEHPMEKRCPIARASLATTALLYEHFEVDNPGLEDAKSYLILDSRASFDKVFKPLLLHWSRLHVASLHAFFRLWKAAGAELEDFQKILQLVKILVEKVVGEAPRTKDVHEVEEELYAFELQRLRELEMELLELTYEDVWSSHLRQVKDELHHEALQFVKEQRIRCLLQGTWFPIGPSEADGPLKRDDPGGSAMNYRYVQLSHNRRYLHWADFDTMGDQQPELDSLPDKIDLSIVSSVVSNVSASSADSTHSDSTLKIVPHEKATTTNTKITIHGRLPVAEDITGRMQQSRQTNHSHSRQASKSSNATHDQQKELVLLTLYPQSHSVASEWLDGLLMLLNQQPITAETSKLINMVSSYGLKIRLLNVRFDEKDMLGEAPEIPSREGLDEDYYYDL